MATDVVAEHETNAYSNEILSLSNLKWTKYGRAIVRRLITVVVIWNNVYMLTENRSKGFAKTKKQLTCSFVSQTDLGLPKPFLAGQVFPNLWKFYITGRLTFNVSHHTQTYTFVMILA